MKKSLWYMFHAHQADFLIDQLLKKSKFFIAIMKEKNFRFEKKLFYSHHNIHFLTHLVKLNSNISFPIKENRFFAL